jgi:integrase
MTKIPALHPTLGAWLLEGPLSAQAPAYVARLRCGRYAMHLLQSGERIDVIALWLGHESPTTTHQYAEADLEMKQKALAKLQDPDTAAKRFRATDSLLEFLKTL